MITSNSNPRVKQVALWQSKAKERRAAGVYLVEGYKMYEEAPEDRIREVYVSEDALDKIGEEPGMRSLRDKLDRTGYEAVAPEVFRKMSDTQTPQGILCVMERREYGLEPMLAAPCPLIVVLENLQDPGNLGTIVRTGEGAGVTGIIMGAGTADIYNPKAIRATMGSIFRVPFTYSADLVGLVGKMREKGIRTYAARLDGRTLYGRFSFRQGTAFLVGSEGGGLTGALADAADDYLRIPMSGGVESLNAAVAASLLMYEARRQRED